MVLFASCNHNFDYIPEHSTPRWEYAPNMYHSQAYEPMTLVDDTTSLEYNVMPYNNGSNLRLPVPGTIKRGFTPYHISKDSLEYASRVNVSPIGANDSMALVQGEVLYSRFCAHCHGDMGKGDGPVNDKYHGVANLTSPTMKTISEGHIFHVITMGKGRMMSHASQLESLERWKIARFVKVKLQAQ